MYKKPKKKVTISSRIGYLKLQTMMMRNAIKGIHDEVVKDKLTYHRVVPLHTESVLKNFDDAVVRLNFVSKKLKEDETDRSEQAAD